MILFWSVYSFFHLGNSSSLNSKSIRPFNMLLNATNNIVLLYSPVTNSRPLSELNEICPSSKFFIWHLKDLFVSFNWTRWIYNWPSGSTKVLCCCCCISWFARNPIEFCCTFNHQTSAGWLTCWIKCCPSSIQPTTWNRSRAWGASWHLNTASLSTLTNWSATVTSCS